MTLAGLNLVLFWAITLAALAIGAAGAALATASAHYLKRILGLAMIFAAAATIAGARGAVGAAGLIAAIGAGFCVVALALALQAHEARAGLQLPAESEREP